MLGRLSGFLAVLSVGLCLSRPATGHVVQTMPAQGLLTHSGGAPLADGTYNMTFALYANATGGSPLWSESKPVTVAGGHGLFSTALGDTTAFPSSLAFDQPYYLGVTVPPNVEMTPRMPLAAVPYAYTSDSLALPFTGVTSLTGNALQVTNTASGAAIAISGHSSTWYGLYGRNGAGSGLHPIAGYGGGVWGDTDNGIGLTGTSLTGFGVYGVANAPALQVTADGAGVWGDSQTAFGVKGTSTKNQGVYGSTTTGPPYPPYPAGPTGAGVFGINLISNDHGALGDWIVETMTGSPNPYPVGVLGVDDHTNWQPNLSGMGVYGTSTNGTGVWGEGTDQGVVGMTGTASGAGVLGRNMNYGSQGQLGAWTNAFGTATNPVQSPVGVYGIAQAQQGVGVFGEGEGGPSGLNYVAFVNGAGVWGDSKNRGGVVGTSALADGVIGWTNDPSHAGVAGINESTGNGIYGRSDGGGWAAHFDGNVWVNGTLIKSGSSFKIDHPLDPAHKWLSHSFVESPDMMDVYNGNVTTDAKGEAVVTLPDWFEALNQDFRYQLTCIGQFAQAIVAEKVKDNRFTIRTDKPNVEVSWQVTGIRHDAWANHHRIPVEEDKQPSEQGRYLNPAEYGQPASMGLG